MSSDCIFCRIVTGEVPSYKIYEDDDYLAFLDLSQFTPGHTLVIPKEHYRFVWDVKNEAEYFKVVKKIANHYRSKGFKYVDSLVFGRQVPHAHIHLVPHNEDIVSWQDALSQLEGIANKNSSKLTADNASQLINKLKLP